jgi:hypothetical protein
VTPTPPPTPPAIVSNCGAVRHDGAQRATAAILNAAVGAILPADVTGAVGGGVAGSVGASAANHAADSTVWTDLEADLQNTTPLTIVGVRLGVKTDDGGSTFYDIPVTIAPDGDVTASQRLARGTVHAGVTACSVVRVNFSDGTSWFAPAPTPAP